MGIGKELLPSLIWEAAFINVSLAKHENTKKYDARMAYFLSALIDIIF
jgi:hypothetical protein